MIIRDQRVWDEEAAAILVFGKTKITHEIQGKDVCRTRKGRKDPEVSKVRVAAQGNCQPGNLRQRSPAWYD